MNLTTNTQTLARELRLLNKIAPSKPSIPILSHVLIRAEDKLHLSATDLEIGMMTTCMAQITTPGIVALPVGKLLAIIEQLPDDDVNIFLDKTHVRVTSGAFKSRLQAMPAEDFPALPEPDGISSSFDAKEFRGLIDRTRYAIAESSSKYLLQGALLTLAGPVAAMVATDSKRLALTTMSREGADTRVVIPVKTLDVLSGQSDIGHIEFTVGERHLFFQSDNRLLISRTLDGQFPAYERIIPRDCDKKATVDRGLLAAAIRRVGLVSEENQATYFEFSDGALDLSSSSAGIGEAAERVVIGYEGEPLKVCCNWRFVLDFLEAAIGQSVTIALKDALSPMLLTDGDNHLAVVMLMRA